MKEKEELLKYVEHQIKHCEVQMQHYIIDGEMNDEQMAGYYLGRKDANNAIKLFIERSL